MTLTWIFLEVAYSDIGVREGGTIGYSPPDRWYSVSCPLPLLGTGIANVMQIFQQQNRFNIKGRSIWVTDKKETLLNCSDI